MITMKPTYTQGKPAPAASLALAVGLLLSPAAQAQAPDPQQYSLPPASNGFAFGNPAQGRDGYLYGLMGYNYPTIYISPPGGPGGGNMAYQQVGPNSQPQYLCTTGMILGRDGDFYGTCNMVGVGTQDFAFRYTPGAYGAQGNFEIFAVIDTNANGVSQFPNALVQASDGNFYGSTYGNGTAGTVFRITPAGVVTTLQTFTGPPAGSGPATPNGPLIEAKDGKLYGTSQEGSNAANGAGTIFSITLKGKLSVFTNFTGGNNLFSPGGGVIQAADGSFYGITPGGGAYNEGALYKVSPKGVVTDLHDFNASTDGSSYPTYAPVQAPDGNFYVPLNGCHAGGCHQGALFELTSGGAFSTLATFSGTCNYSPPGCLPNSGEIVHTDGSLYGVLEQGGVNDWGVLYADTPSPALKPNVKLQEASGAVGSTVDILGQGFTGATKVHFGKVAASFSVVSDTYMTATVPAGAASGFVVVTEPGAKLQSQAKFLVK
jgi:uncharacterized repeat protein (TIGR03803 family)